jgi:hypothetical protein
VGDYRELTCAPRATCTLRPAPLLRLGFGLRGRIKWILDSNPFDGLS